MMAKILEFFWRMLPDKCQMSGCNRRGVRGNESRIGGKIVCDDCHMRVMMRAETRRLRGDRW